MIKSMLLAVVMVKVHNNALLSPLTRLGRITLCFSRPKALRYVHNLEKVSRYGKLG
jgi:hypothetical protein